MMMMGGGGNTTVKDDYTFEMKVPAGKLRVFAGVSTPGWTVHAVRLNGVDVTDGGIEFTPGGDAGNIEIEMTNHVCRSVRRRDQRARRNDQGLLRDRVFPGSREVDVEHALPQSGPAGPGRALQDPRAAARPLLRHCARLVDPSDSGDPEFLDRIRSQATTFSLSDGETKALDLKLQTGS